MADNVGSLSRAPWYSFVVSNIRSLSGAMVQDSPWSTLICGGVEINPAMSWPIMVTGDVALCMVLGFRNVILVQFESAERLSKV